MLLIIILYALLALTFPLSQFALYYTNPLFLIAFRMIIAGTLLLGFYRLKHDQISIEKRDWFLFLKTSFFYIFLAFVPEFWALQYVSSLKTTIMYSLTPFITAFLEFFLLHQHFGKEKVSGMFIGTAGLLPLLFLPNTQCLPFGQCRVQFLPEMMLLLAIIAGAYAWFLVKGLMSKGYSLVIINGITMLVGGLMSLLAYFIFYPTINAPVTNIWRFLQYTGALIIISNVIVYYLYGHLLKKYSVTLLALAGFLSPLFGMIYAWLFFGERLSWQYFISFALVVLGLLLFSHGEKKTTTI